MKYANYNETTGKLLGWYDSAIHEKIPAPNIEVSDADWQSAIDMCANSYDVVNHTFSIQDFRSFAELQESKLSEVRTAYTNANETDIGYMTSSFQSDKDSQDLIVTVLSGGSVPDGFFWLDTLNNQIPMTYLELQGMSRTLVNRGQLNFIKYQDLKTKVKLATTQADLDLIVW